MFGINCMVSKLSIASLSKDNEITTNHKFLCWESPTDIYLFKVHNENTRSICEIRSKLTIKTLAKTLERRQVSAGWARVTNQSPIIFLTKTCGVSSP